MTATTIEKTDDWKSLEGRLHEPCLVIPDVFSAEECTEVIALCARYPMAAGKTFDGAEYSVNPEYRKLTTAYIARSPGMAWIFDRMDKVFFACARHWRIDVRETVEDLKFLVYEPGSHFSKWHADIGASYSSRRKLSMSVELDDSTLFEGGDLQIFPQTEGHAAGPRRRAGTAVVFPSHLHHRVTPVEAGVRRALVNWISGPPLV
jgi:PKHD-type hydroxylase